MGALEIKIGAQGRIQHFFTLPKLEPTSPRIFFRSPIKITGSKEHSIN
jgi:hypothetical protein